jgi:hypothetical protein
MAASQSWLEGQDAPEAVIVAHEVGNAESNADARRWIRRLLDEQDPLGSWGGDLLWTAESLLTIQELRAAADVVEMDPAVRRAYDWIRSRRGVAGSWADGCIPDRHREGLCHHFVGGFFAPVPPEVPLAEGRLRCGARLVGDPEIRLVTSAMALRASLELSPASGDDRLHLAGLRRLVRSWGSAPPAGLSVGALLSALHALIVSGSSDDAEVVEWGLRLVGGRQRGDGSWVETDAFQALDVIGAAADAGIASDQMRRALWHGARLLVASQQADGSWGPAHGARRALIAWRTFRRLAGPGSTH